MKVHKVLQQDPSLLRKEQLSMKLIKAGNYENLSKIAGDMIIEKVQQSNTINLGLATGSTPEELYRYLVKDHLINKTTYKGVKTFNLDEYIGLDPANKNSYHYYMKEHLFTHIDIPRKNIHIPNGNTKNLVDECKQYDLLIEKQGGIDLQILGLGQNGHIGFNEPGTSFESKTHVVELDDSTRLANARFFNNLDRTPTHAITMGVSTILKSKEILLLVSGETKAKALQRLLEGKISNEFPSSILKTHSNVTIIADYQALAV